MAHYLLVILAYAALYLLTHQQLLVFRELVLHLLGLEEMNVLLKQHANLCENFVDPGSGLRDEGENIHGKFQL